MRFHYKVLGIWIHSQEVKMVGVRVFGCVFALSYCCFMLLAVAQITHPSEVTALRAVKRSLIDPKKNLRNWKGGDPCTSNWTGVICFDGFRKDGYLHVQELQLLNMNLSGSLSPELGQLSYLKILDFMWNEISESVPKEIGNIKSLKLLLLNGNKLSGPLPEELGYLPNLDRLQVDLNYISGSIPKSFGNLTKVKHLHMNNNSISGQIPSELLNLPIVRHLLLDSNHLSGYLPKEFSNSTELRILSLRNCSLHGVVPDLSTISQLSYLDLSFNRLTGSIPSNKLSDNITTIDLSDNNLTGSIPRTFSYLPRLQRLSLENNFLTGSVPASIWNNKSFNTTARLKLDLRNNKLRNILGDLNPPPNVTLRLQGNPVCNNGNIQNMDQFCGPKAGGDGMPESSTKKTNSTIGCSNLWCPLDDFYEFVPESPVKCFCASPIRIGYRLKSPSFYDFPPYVRLFEMYLTNCLNLSLYQLSIDSFLWEHGPRLRMYLKLFPTVGVNHSFNTSEIQRLRGRFTSWEFEPSDFFGPYELLNFTLLGPYSNVNVETSRKSISKGIWAAIILGAIACAIMVCGVVALLIARRHATYGHNMSRKKLSSKISEKIVGVKSFTFREMALATENFSILREVGRGGYGRVYKGILSDNTIVAIKRAEEGSLQGQKEFLTEIKLLSRLHHRNLVSLVGYCDEEGEQMLVYEFMQNGSLQDWLSAKAKEDLNFGMRARIALGSAKGILYLHTEAQPPVFHRDIKASNILLDSKLTAKVADFGLSRLAPVFDDEGAVPDHVSTAVKGTPGYLDPEYFMTHKLTDKSDVYSLGVVFLELLTGMQPVSRGKNIVREVNIAYQSGIIFSIIDSRMGSYSTECVERFVALALRCCQEKPEKRPSMLDVVRELENILRLMAETDTSLSKSVYLHSGTSASSSSSHVAWDLNVSSNVSGSDLVSDVNPSFKPR